MVLVQVLPFLSSSAPVPIPVVGGHGGEPQADIESRFLFLAHCESIIQTRSKPPRLDLELHRDQARHGRQPRPERRAGEQHRLEIPHYPVRGLFGQWRIFSTSRRRRTVVVKDAVALFVWGAFDPPCRGGARLV